MKLDQKYFIPFLAIMAVITALLITFFTISSQEGQRESFREVIVKQDSLRAEQMQVLNSADSLSVTSFSNKYVILDFWATWSNFSQNTHKEIAGLKRAYPDTVEVIAAVVQDRKEKVDSYISRNGFPFHYVNGTTVFNKYGIPGMPTEIIYAPGGEIIDILFGSSDSTRFDSLRTLLKNGR